MLPEQRPDTTLSTPDLSPLLHDLEQVLALVQEAISLREQPNSFLALVRLVEGLSLEEWQRVSARVDNTSWLALPIKNSALSSLLAMQETLEELFYQRDHDTLTGLANRRFFDQHLEMELQRSLRTKTDLSLVILDLDNFKNVNDSYGHQTGDEVLVALGKVLKHALRPYDIAARIGGEEFCLVLPGASLWRARNLAQRILEQFRLESFSAPDGTRFHTSFSAGVATTFFHANTINAQALLALADSAMYQAKANGKNCVVISKPCIETAENPALVREAEKQFLFNGTNHS